MEKLDLQHESQSLKGAAAEFSSGPVLSVLRLRRQRVAGSKPQRHRRPSEGSSVALRGGHPAHTQSITRPHTLHAESQPAAGPRQPLTQHPRVGRRSVGESQASVGPVSVVSRGGEDHRLHVPPRCVKGKLWRRAAGFGGRGGQRVQLSSGGQQQGRQRGGGEGGVAVSRTQRGSGGGGGEGPREERSGPVVFKDLHRQGGDERQQPVGDVSQDQLLVGVAADSNVGRAGLKDEAEGGAGRAVRGYEAGGDEEGRVRTGGTGSMST